MLRSFFCIFSFGNCNLVQNWQKTTSLTPYFDFKMEAFLAKFKEMNVLGVLRPNKRNQLTNSCIFKSIRTKTRIGKKSLRPSPWFSCVFLSTPVCFLMPKDGFPSLSRSPNLFKRIRSMFLTLLLRSGISYRQKLHEGVGRYLCLRQRSKLLPRGF